MVGRDRTELQLIADADAKAVLEFMQDRIPAAKLAGVAEGAARMARLLWDRFPQESCSCLKLELEKPIMTDLQSPSLPASI
jgi:hypothetical protein